MPNLPAQKLMLALGHLYSRQVKDSADRAVNHKEIMKEVTDTKEQLISKGLVTSLYAIHRDDLALVKTQVAETATVLDEMRRWAMAVAVICVVVVIALVVIIAMRGGHL